MTILKSDSCNTPLGKMLAIASDKALYLLEFINCKKLETEIEGLKSVIISGRNTMIDSIEHELDRYFEGSLKTFQTPLRLQGSQFQKSVWEELMRIPYGQTHSYLDQATALGSPSSCRAVANANGANKLTIIIPCHRIIRSTGELGGYKGGVPRKQWLLDHESKHQ